jgi:hypothetical protein
VENSVGNKNKRMEMDKKVSFLIITLMLFAANCFAQDSSRVFFTTGIGAIKVRHTLRHTLKPSVAFNSGLELTNKKHFFGLLTADFNTLKYDQQIKDMHSPYLFQHTNSSLLMLGLNGGKNFYFDNKRWFVSAYAGGGYLNIGEPRATLVNNIITQEITRKGQIFGRGGSRVAYKTKIRFLQTIYLDADWWTSPVTVQGAKLNGFGFFIGTRMGM